MSLKEFSFTSENKCPMDSEGFHIDFPLHVMMKAVESKAMELVAVFNSEDPGYGRVYLDEQTLQVVRTEARMRFNFAMDWLKEERQGREAL